MAVLENASELYAEFITRTSCYAKLYVQNHSILSRTKTTGVLYIYVKYFAGSNLLISIDTSTIEIICNYF